MGEHTLSTVFSESVNTSAEQLQILTMRAFVVMVVMLVAVVAPAVEAVLDPCSCSSADPPVCEDPTWWPMPIGQCTCISSQVPQTIDEFDPSSDCDCDSNCDAAKEKYRCNPNIEDPCVNDNGVRL